MQLKVFFFTLPIPSVASQLISQGIMGNKAQGHKKKKKKTLLEAPPLLVENQDSSRASSEPRSSVSCRGKNRDEGKVERRHMKRKFSNTQEAPVQSICQSVCLSARLPACLSVCRRFKGREHPRLHMKRICLMTSTSSKTLARKSAY